MLLLNVMEVFNGSGGSLLEDIPCMIYQIVCLLCM